MRVGNYIAIVAVVGIGWMAPGLAGQGDSPGKNASAACDGAKAARLLHQPILPGGGQIPVELASDHSSGEVAPDRVVPSASGDSAEATELRAIISELRKKTEILSNSIEGNAEGDSGSQSSRRSLAEANRQTGDEYRQGRYRQKDAMKALSNYLRAIEYGDVESFNRLGALYLSGELGVVDPVRAREAFLDGIEGGDARSAHWLGRMHLEALGTTKSPQLARGWWVLATAMGDRQAPEDLMRLYLGCVIAAKDWRIRGLGWGLLAFADERFSDDEIARLVAGLGGLASFTVEEIGAARLRAKAFDEGHPGWRQRAARRQPGYGEEPRNLGPPAR